MGDGVTGPPFPTPSPPLTPSFLVSFSPFALAYLYSFFNSLPPYLLSLISYPYTPSIIHSPLSPPLPWHESLLSLSLSLCKSFSIINSFCRSAVAVHCCRVPVHPPAGHRGHPHVHRGVSLWQCHRRPQAQRLRCHIHRALRWVRGQLNESHEYVICRDITACGPFH